MIKADAPASLVHEKQAIREVLVIENVSPLPPFYKGDSTYSTLVAWVWQMPIELLFYFYSMYHYCSITGVN
jgi:hypothetical protein